MPPELRQHRDVIDVNLVEHQPERAERRYRTVIRTHHVDVADVPVLQLPRVHLARPWIAERLRLDAQHAIEIGLTRERLDPERHATDVVWHHGRSRRQFGARRADE